MSEAGAAAAADLAIKPHADLEALSVDALKERLAELTRDIEIGTRNGAPADVKTWLIQERRAVDAELRRRFGGAVNGAAKQGDFWPAPLSMREFLNRPKDATRWVWDRALALGSTSIVVARPRDGKSTFACNLALAVARGVPFLGRDTVQAPAFYLSLDNSAEDLADIVAPLGVTEHDKLFMHAGAVPEKGLEWLIDQVRKLDLKFVVIDTLQRFFKIENVNDYAETVNAMTPLDNAAKQIGFSVMYIHHAGKSTPEGSGALDASLGTTGLKGMCPYYFHLTRMGELKQRILTTDFRNGRNFESIAVKIDRMTGWLRCDGTLEDAQINEAMPKVREYLALVGAMGATETEIRKNVPMKGVVVSKAVRELFGFAEVERNGLGKRGAPFRYFLAGSLTDRSGVQPVEPESMPKEDESLF